MNEKVTKVAEIQNLGYSCRAHSKPWAQSKHVTWCKDISHDACILYCSVGVRAQLQLAANADPERQQRLFNYLCSCFQAVRLGWILSSWNDSDPVQGCWHLGNESADRVFCLSASPFLSSPSTPHLSLLLTASFCLTASQIIFKT